MWLLNTHIAKSMLKRSCRPTHKSKPWNAVKLVWFGLWADNFSLHSLAFPSLWYCRSSSWFQDILNYNFTKIPSSLPWEGFYLRHWLLFCWFSVIAYCCSWQTCFMSVFWSSRGVHSFSEHSTLLSWLHPMIVPIFSASNGSYRHLCWLHVSLTFLNNTVFPGETQGSNIQTFWAPNSWKLT